MQFKLDLLSRYRTLLMGVAILWIMFFHSPFTMFDNIPLNLLHKYGYAGVEFFFLLSGLGIYFAYKKEDLKSFYKKRFLRVLPYFLPIVFFQSLFFLVNNHITFSSFLLRITLLDYFADDNQNSWYLSAALLFYLITPLLFLYNKKMTLAITFILSIAFNLMLSHTSYSYLLLTTDRFPIYVLGIYCGYLIANNKNINTIWLIGSFLLGTALLIGSYIIDQNDINFCMNLEHYPFLLLTPPLCYILAKVFSYFKNYKFHILHFLGSYSLCLYIFHERIVRVICRFNLDNTLTTIICIVIASLMAFVWQELVSRVLLRIQKST